nr:hypothetical protein [Hyphomicrobium sp. 99]
MVAIEGEAMRGLKWVRVHEFASGSWGIGGKALTIADVKALQRGGARRAQAPQESYSRDSPS